MERTSRSTLYNDMQMVSWGIWKKVLDLIICGQLLNALDSILQFELL
jgi:hypothetical protein